MSHKRENLFDSSMWFHAQAHSQMRRDIAILWAKELARTVVEKELDFLRRDEAFSSLGLLCNLHASRNPNGDIEDNWEKIGHVWYYLDQHHVLPIEVIEWAGFQARRFPETKNYVPNRVAAFDRNSNESFDSILEMNWSSFGFTFVDMAKVITEHWREI